MKTGALYIRVSTHDQDELSPDAQIRLGLDFAKSNKLIIPKEFIFVESVSGRKVSKRHEFQRMISIAKSPEHPIDAIVVWKFSRFARNQEESQKQEAPQEEMVWISSSGSRYHSKASCSNMENPTEVTISTAKSRNLTPCKRCY